MRALRKNMTHNGCILESSNTYTAKTVMNSICFICGTANSYRHLSFLKKSDVDQKHGGKPSRSYFVQMKCRFVYKSLYPICCFLLLKPQH